MTVIQGDISTVEADAIVHPTNASFYLGGEVGMCIASYSSLFFSRDAINAYLQVVESQPQDNSQVAAVAIILRWSQGPLL